MDEHVCDTENEGIDLHHEMLLFSEDHRWYVSLRSDDVEAVAQISAPRCRMRWSWRRVGRSRGRGRIGLRSGSGRVGARSSGGQTRVELIGAPQARPVGAPPTSPSRSVTPAGAHGTARGPDPVP